MLLGKLDSDSDSDSAPPGYKPRRLSLSDSERVCEKHESQPFTSVELGALSSSPSLLNEHQNKAVQFLWELMCRREGGVLLISNPVLSASLHTQAIDKGMGKRVITAALLATKFANTPAASVSDNDDNFCSQKPALVVVHDCVLEQWMHVLRTWTHCSVVELCSNEKKLCRHIQKVQEGDYAIAICSYATLALRTHKIAAVAWDVIVYDEASCLSKGIVNIRAARTLVDMQTVQPPVMFGITSTALEHTYKEMWQLQDLLFPEEYRWTEKEFHKRYTRPITAGSRLTATRSEHALCVQRCSELAAAVASRVLYVKRVEVGALSLLDCPTVAVLVQLSPLQSDVYRAVLQLPEPSNLAVCRVTSWAALCTVVRCVLVLPTVYKWVPTSIVNEHYRRHVAPYNASYANHALTPLLTLRLRRQPCDCSDSESNSTTQRCQCCYKLPFSLDNSGRPLDTMDARKTVLWLQAHAPKHEE
eukprot:14215-Heterococcus_DN1.PRE.3